MEERTTTTHVFKLPSGLELRLTNADPKDLAYLQKIESPHLTIERQAAEIKEQRGDLEVQDELIKKQGKTIMGLEAELAAQKECIRSLTEQNAALIWERDGHGKSNVPDIFVQNAALTGENMILRAELAACKADRDELIQCLSLLANACKDEGVRGMDTLIGKCDKYLEAKP